MTGTGVGLTPTRQGQLPWRLGSDLEAAGHCIPTAEEAPEETVARVCTDRKGAGLCEEHARAQKRLAA